MAAATMTPARPPRAAPPAGKRFSFRVKTTVGTAVLLVAALYVVAPLYWLVVVLDQEHRRNSSTLRRSCRRPTCPYGPT